MFKNFSNSRFSTILTVGGQSIWALSQALLIVILSLREGIELVGLFTASLSVFSPICLIGSLNLRNLLAIDNEKSISLKEALLIRSVVVTLAITVSLALFTSIQTGDQNSLVILILLGIRSLDQLSDLGVGFHQRQGNHIRIALSFAGRGLSSLLPYILAYTDHITIIEASLAALIITAIWCIFGDLLPMFADSKNKFAKLPILRRPGIFKLATFPVTDSLHVNSLRYLTIINGSTLQLGLLGISQTVYSSIQLVTTALGYSYLARSRIIAENYNPAEFIRHVSKGIIWGAIPSIILVIILYIIPEKLYSLAFGINYESGKTVCILVAIAMSPIAISGFTSQCIMTMGSATSYALNPFLGIMIFWLCATIFMFLDFQIEGMLIIFIISGLCRIASNLCSLYNIYKGHLPKLIND